MEQKNFDQQESLEKNISKKEKGHGFFSEVVKFTLIAIFVILPLRTFIAEPFIVSGASMDPTFTGGNYLIIDKLSYRLEDPKRGDVVVLKYPLDKTRFFIKRIIGLPEETISIIDGDVYITKNGEVDRKQIEESYVVNKVNENLTMSLGVDEYFVMGDNRPVSLDSRSWGALKRNLIKGKPLLRLLPVNRIGVSPGETK